MCIYNYIIVYGRLRCVEELADPEKVPCGKECQNGWMSPPEYEYLLFICLERGLKLTST